MAVAKGRPALSVPGVKDRSNFCLPSLSSYFHVAPTRLLTRIHEKWYDLTEFERYHPGGPVALGLAKGRDATVMFECHHPFTHRRILDAILEKYEIKGADEKHLETLEQKYGIEEHKFEWPSAFGEALKFEVRQYFEGEAKKRNVSLREATKATPGRWMEIAIMAAVFVYSMPGFFRGEWFSLFAFPLATWLVGGNAYHDGAHFALTTSWRVNCYVPYLFPWISSPFVWYHQHNIGHHSYPNIAHRDPDMLHHSWLKREVKTVKWSPLHAHQSQIWFIAFFWCVAVEVGLAITGDLWMLYSKLYNGVVPMMEMSGTRMFFHVVGRVSLLVAIHAWPFFLFDSWSRCFMFSLIPYVWYSVLFMMNTQINHLLPHTAHATDPDWYKHQVITAQDFGIGSKFCFIFSGGLNYQVIHHLFPTVSHCHLPLLQPIVVSLCAKYEVEYTAAGGYVSAIKAHHAHSVNMSRKDHISWWWSLVTVLDSNLSLLCLFSGCSIWFSNIMWRSFNANLNEKLHCIARDFAYQLEAKPILINFPGPSLAQMSFQRWRGTLTCCRTRRRQDDMFLSAQLPLQFNEHDTWLYQNKRNL